MNRRDGLKFSLLAVASLTACKHYNDRDKSRAHSTAMFLLILHPSYFEQARSDVPQTSLPGKSLLRKVDAKVFNAMRAYLKDQVAQYTAAVVAKRYQDIRDEAYNASKFGVHSESAPAAPPYTSPDECPCAFDFSCAQVEALLNF
jgi:hypothetical protein